MNGSSNSFLPLLIQKQPGVTLLAARTSSNTWLLTNTITINFIITGSKGFFWDIYPFAILSDTTILYYSQASADVFFGAVSVLVSAYWCHPTEGGNPIKDQGGNVFPQKVIKTGEGSRFPRIHN